MGAIKRRPLDTEFMMGGVEVKLDTAIVLDAQSGSREGFTRLYEAVAPALYRTALYTLGNSHDAEDVVSETFIEAYRGLAGLRDPQAFMTWIYRILSARCNRKIREYVRARNEEVDLEEMVQQPGDQGAFSETVLSRADLVRALESLSAAERHACARSSAAVRISIPQGRLPPSWVPRREPSARSCFEHLRK